MNELFEPDEAPRRPLEQGPATIDYDDGLETVDPGYRYVLRRPSETGAGAGDP
jgi:hypothetical protein